MFLVWTFQYTQLYLKILLKIKNLKLKTIIGIYPWEEKIDREIVINIEIDTDFNQSLKSDDINDTIDYDFISSAVKNLVAEKKFKLVEKMAQEIMDLIMQNQKVKKCKLEIDKVGSIDFIDSFSVTIEQERKNGY